MPNVCRTPTSTSNDMTHPLNQLLQNIQNITATMTSARFDCSNDKNTALEVRNNVRNSNIPLYTEDIDIRDDKVVPRYYSHSTNGGECGEVKFTGNMLGII